MVMLARTPIFQPAEARSDQQNSNRRPGSHRDLRRVCGVAIAPLFLGCIQREGEGFGLERWLANEARHFAMPSEQQVDRVHWGPSAAS